MKFPNVARFISAALFSGLSLTTAAHAVGIGIDLYHLNNASYSYGQTFVSTQPGIDSYFGGFSNFQYQLSPNEFSYVFLTISLNAFGLPVGGGTGYNFDGRTICITNNAPLGFNCRSQGVGINMAFDYPGYPVTLQFAFTATAYNASLTADAFLFGPGAEEPLPASLPLFATGLGVLGFVARRAQKVRRTFGPKYKRTQK